MDADLDIVDAVPMGQLTFRESREENLMSSCSTAFRVGGGCSWFGMNIRLVDSSILHQNVLFIPLYYFD
jgi:hypothetical protein